jgi:hypothetical protein
LYTERAFSRRDFLTGTGKAVVIGGLLGLGLGQAQPAAATQQTTGIDPLIWVWKFSADGPLGEIRDTLADTGIHVILKTHDGTNWMAEHDSSPDAVSGPGQVSRLAGTFEQAGIPFHAWCVVQGHDPIREAQMCAEVLQSGARDLYLDLEPSDGSNYWQGSAADALAFGAELRRLAPQAWLVVAPDSRPWQAGSVPLAEFVSFSNAIAPQAYWETFQGPTNREKYAQHGYFVGPEGVTPELVIDASVGTFQGFGRPIYPIGQGASSPERWRRFIASAMSYGIGSVSLWRYGASDRSAFDVLRESLPKPAPIAAAPTAPQEAAAAQAPQVAVPPVEVPAQKPPETAPAAAPANAPSATSSHAPEQAPAQPPGDAAVPSPGAPAVVPEGQPVPEAAEPDRLLVMQQTVDDMKSRVIAGLGRGLLSFFR